MGRIKIEVKGQKAYRYEDVWKQSLYKVEDANTDLSAFTRCSKQLTKTLLEDKAPNIFLQFSIRD
jgi:hypothetical protein